jgi:L-ascorbate metabolism protein UlaG (beta-lactamase superfamily)
MRVRWLGWAGVEVEHGGEHVVIDPLEDPRAVFAWLGEAAAQTPAPEITRRGPGRWPDS